MGDDDDPVSAPSSPLGIPSWLWLTLLTFFMLFIIWLSLRNAFHLLPEPVQRILQDLADRYGPVGQIRLPSNATGAGGPSHQINLDVDGSDNDDDDELPLASRFHPSEQRYFGSARRQPRLDRFIQLFTGTGNRYAGLRPGLEHPSHEDEERVLDLPSLPSRHTLPLDKRRRQDSLDTNTSSPLLRANSDEADAASLPRHFSIGSMPQPKLQLSPVLDRSVSFSSPRSPLRSPSLSRTPSLTAIAEESSVSPRSSQDAAREDSGDPFRSLPSTLVMRSSASSDSASSDWASARSDNTYSAK